ncbi:helix-turn-helix domain-containing protein [Halosimplex halobium]|uniref:helix-turn-helix domain-containing protein n=1 Tax=Halosimplex halobium TaxID=3396618 RepID=UPI003F55CA55
MIDEDPDFEEILVCVFGIRDHEVRTYLMVLDNPDSTVEELADRLDRDRSNVNRALATLREKGLVSRKNRIVPGGGNVYQYTATPLAEARALMHETLDEWTDSVHTRIDRFGDEEF